MREILFRGKCVDNDGEWAVGAGVLQAKNHAYIFICAGAPCNRDYYATLEVYPETVGQYTGLTDKSGNKIFEGDILEFTDSDNEKSPYLIKWDGISSCYKIWTPEKYCDDCDYWGREYFEIIGNIFDNPELFSGTSYEQI